MNIVKRIIELLALKKADINPKELKVEDISIGSIHKAYYCKFRLVVLIGNNNGNRCYAIQDKICNSIWSSWYDVKWLPFQGSVADYDYLRAAKEYLIVAYNHDLELGLYKPPTVIDGA